MPAKDQVTEEKKKRQKTIDKLSIKSGHAYTYDKDSDEGSGCLSNAKSAREKTQRKLDR